MATKKQKAAARRNVKKAQKTARAKRTIANMPKKKRTALGKQGANIAQRDSRSPGDYSTWTKSELMNRAREVGLEGRSKMGRDELIQELRKQS